MESKGEWLHNGSKKVSLDPTMKRTQTDDALVIARLKKHIKLLRELQAAGKQFLTDEEVSVITAVSVSTLRKWRVMEPARGPLCVKLETYRLYPVKDLIAYCEGLIVERSTRGGGHHRRLRREELARSAEVTQ